MTDQNEDKPAVDAGMSNVEVEVMDVAGLPEQPQPARTELNAEEASIIVEAAAETPVTELVEQPQPETLDPVDANAIRIFGENYAGIRDKCAELGIDYAGHVMSVCSRLNDFESTLELELGDFERSVPAEVWPAIGHAIGVNHTIENARRSLMMAITSGMLPPGHSQQAMADLFSMMAGAMNTFVNATLTQLIGQMTLGFDMATVKERILDPFNRVMELKRQIFDLVGEANQAFGIKLMLAQASQATEAAQAAAAAGNDGEPPAGPTVH